MEKYIAFGAIILSIVALVFATAGGSAEQEQENTLQVSGDAELSYAPDKATVLVEVTARDQDAAAAQSSVEQRGNAVLQALEDQGYTVETQSFSVNRRSRYNPRTEEEEFEGYEASHVLKVTTQSVDTAGDIIDTSFANGADQIRSVEFGLSDSKQEEARREALKTAGEEARGKAQDLASAMGVSLGSPMSISESNYRFVPARAESYAADAGGGAAARTKVSPGDVTVNAQISATYHLG